MFFRIHADGVRTAIDLRGHFAGPVRSTCWIIGGGPSLREAPCDRVQLSPVPKFAVNLCGFGLIRPNIWTAYDPTVRFHRSTFLDGSILKLLPARRATDIVPGTAHKVGDCPNTLFFERDGQRGFHNFLGDESGDEASVVDWQDSLVQAIDLAWRLGFRRLLLIGCDMAVRPPEEHVRRAALRGVLYQPEELLRGFYDRCRAAGLDPADLEAAEAIAPYHFDETKALAAAQQTDFHYYRVVQYLRLSRRAMALAGLELISATPGSRLNSFFPYLPVEELLDGLTEELGNPASEMTRGQYSRRIEPAASALMRDFRPHNWPQGQRVGASRPQASSEPASAPTRAARLRAAIDELPEVEVPLRKKRDMRSTIIIAQHGQPQLTVGCIESIRRHHGDEPEIVLVDEGSPAPDIEQVAGAGLINVELVRQSHHGVTAAWNAGAARAHGEVLIFLNNDVITIGRWVTQLTSLLEDARTVIAGVQRRRERHLDPELLGRLPSQVFAAGWCFAVRRRDFEAVHGFRGALRLYFSDTDLQSRLLLRCGRGIDGIATARLPLRHLGHATTAFCTTRKEQWHADRRRFRRFWSGLSQITHASLSAGDS